MGRILLLIIIALLIWLLFKGFLRAQARRSKSDVPAPRSDKGEDMVACARCGVNLPRSDAQLEGEALVCRDNPRCIEVR